MGEPAIRLVQLESPAASEPAPRVAVEPAGMMPLAELIVLWPDGQTPEARERAARRYCEALAGGLQTAGMVAKVAGRWHVSSLAPDPTAPPESGRTIRDLLFLRTGRVTRELLGVHIGPKLAAAMADWTADKRDRFYGRAGLARQLDEHAQHFAGMPQAKRDRLFDADEKRAAWCAAQGIARRSARSVRKWRAKVKDDVDPDGRGRPRLDQERSDETCTPAAWDLFKVLYLDPRRRSVQLCWEITAAEAEKQGWSWPEYHSIRRRVKAELPPGISDYYRLGPRRWEAKHQTFIERDRRAQYRSNQCWVADHTKENRWALIKGGWVRLYLTLWVDAATGKALAWAWSRHPNSDTILHTFRTAVLRHGAPLHVVFDNGKDFRAGIVAGGRKRLNKERVAGVMQRFGIAVTWAEPYRGQSKGVVEREFRVIDERFWKLLPTYCGACPAERPESLNDDLRHGQIEAPDEEEYRGAFAEFVDAENARPREHLNGLTPDQAFSLDPIPRRTAPAGVLEELCLPVVECVVGRLGVQVRGVHYGQNETRLLPLQGQTVNVRFDPADASEVKVLDQDGRFICSARNARLTGVTQADIRESKRRKKRALLLVKAAAPARLDRLDTLTSLSIQVAAQRRAAERRAERRIAVGAEAEPEPRAMQLLPGAAEAAEALRESSRGIGAFGQKGVDTDRDVWELLTTPAEPSPREESAAEAQERLLRELGDLPRDVEPAESALERFGRTWVEPRPPALPTPDYSRFAAPEPAEEPAPFSYARFADPEAGGAA